LVNFSSNGLSSDLFIAKLDTIQIMSSQLGLFPNSYSLYPNPANSEITISPSCFLSTSVEILDLQGRIIFSERQTSKKFIVDVSGFAKGIYLVKIQNDKESQLSKILVK
jgi:hypothetical protein